MLFSSINIFKLCVSSHLMILFRKDNSPATVAQVVQHPLQDGEVTDSIRIHVIPHAFKWYQRLPCLVLSDKGQALASLLLFIASLANKSKIIVR